MSLKLSNAGCAKPDRKRRWRRLAWLLPVWLGILSGAAGASDGEIIRIGVSVTPLSAPLVIAAEKGFFRAEGLRVELQDYVGGNRTAQALLRGEVDLATSSEAVVMFNSFKHRDFSILATFVTSDNDVKILTTKASGIRSLGDLPGRRVGTVIGASAQFFLDHSLLMHGLDADLVEVTGIAPEQTLPVLHDGTVDAVVSWEPFIQLARDDLGSDAVLVAHGHFYTETFNLLCGREFAHNHPQQVRRLLRALLKSVEFIASHPQQAQTLVARHFSSDLGNIKAVWPDLRFSVRLDQWLITVLEAQARWARARGFVEGDKMPNYLDYILYQPLKDVAPDSIGIIH